MTGAFRLELPLPPQVVMGGEAGGAAVHAPTASARGPHGRGRRGRRGYAVGPVEPVLGFFWPVFPIAGWGIGVIMNAWDVYGRQEITEEDIHREMDRLGK